MSLTPRTIVRGLLDWVQRSVMLLVLLVLCTILTLSAHGFFSTDNLLNVLRNVSLKGLIALGMTMVIIAGEIDLSVGSAVAFSGCLAAVVAQHFCSSEGASAPVWAVLLGLAAGMAACLAVGALTGLLRVHFRVPTFISTLAWLTALRGAAGLITGGFSITPFPDGYNFLGGGYLLGVPFPALVFVAGFVVVQFLMSFTSFGRAVYAVGGNTEAARLSGIRVGRVKILVMVIVAGLAALSGMLLSSQVMSGSPRSAKGWELDVIAAVIIGGTDLFGGRGTVWGTMIGVIFLGVLSNGMTLLGLGEYWREVVQGALILMAVLLNQIDWQALRVGAARLGRTVFGGKDT